MMDKYDLSYRVEGGSTGEVSLVVERLSWNPPPFQDEWDAIGSLASTHEIRVLYQLNTMPPGIPTWFIARSHRFSRGTHWRTGALLQHTDGRHLALARADPHRKTVELIVRGPSPTAFFSILDDGLNRTLERFPGLGIQDATRMSIEQIRKTMTHMDGKLTEQTEYSQRMFLKILRIAQVQQEARCPSIFAVVPVTQRRFTLMRLAGQTYELHLYCEEPGAWHRLPEPAGCYPVTEPAEWLRRYGPYLHHLLTVLKHAAPLAGPVLGMSVDKLDEHLKADCDLMKELISQVPAELRYQYELRGAGAAGARPSAHAASDADFRALEAMLTTLDPNRGWGGLSRHTTPEGLTLYLCDQHLATYRQKAQL
jgi:hypothetical protein